MMKVIRVKAIALGLSAILALTGCGSEKETDDVKIESEVELEEIGEMPQESEVEDPFDEARRMSQYYTPMSDYGLFDEHNFTGVRINNPITGESKEYIFSYVTSFSMGSDEYGTAESFMEEAKDVLNGLLPDEALENCNIVMVIYVYESPFDENVKLSERRVIFEFDVAGIRKSIVIVENQFKSVSDDIYMINRDITLDGESFSTAVFIQGDECVTDFYSPALLETFQLPRGLYTTEDLSKLETKLNQEDKEKSLTYEIED